MKPLQAGDPTAVGDGRYRLSARLGQGGMGVVYLGWSPSGRAVAVKVVRPELSTDGEFRRRFAQEVSAARRVSGFHTAPVVDADPDGDPAWLVTAYVPGPSLHAVVARHGPLPEDTLTVLAAGLAEALEAVHRAGLVHRDLKPANIIVADDGPRVIDFGIARALDRTSLTQTGLQIGTPGFLAPEQLTGGAVTPAVDLFALGIVLCHAAGAAPFGDGPSAAVLYRAVHEPPDLHGVPESLRGVVGDCLAKDPGRRPSPRSLLERLVVTDRDDGDWLPPHVRAMLDEHSVRPPGARRPAEPTSRPAPTPTPDPTPYAQPAPEPRPQPGPTPAPRPAPEPTSYAQPAPEPRPQPGPTPIAQPAPEPAPRPEPTLLPAPEPAPLPQPQPVASGVARAAVPTEISLPQATAAPAPRSRNRRRGLLGAALGAAALAAVIAVIAVQPFAHRGRGHHGTAEGSSPAAAPLPTTPLLIRLDLSPAGSQPCHSVIARRPTARDTPRQLVAGGVCDSLPQWAPDRSSFAFTRTSGDRSEVWIAAADGGHPRRVAEIAKGSRVSWAPDGRRLAVLRVVDGVQQLVVVTVADGTSRQLSHGRERIEDPAWSPTGGRIAVCRRLSGRYQVYLVDPQAPDLPWQQVTSAPVRALDPAWSPDGRLIAYNSGAGGQGDIHVIGADGTGDRVVAGSAENEMDPSWSPDGKWIAYVRGPVPEPRIWAVRADGTAPQRLTTGAPREGHPTWR